MEEFMEQFDDLRIHLEDIILATNTFHKDNLIGNGGFGMVYKGELSRFKKQGMVAFKRLNRRYGQGEPEFLKEITMLSLYRHENVISLLGFCKEGDEMILAYEHASNGSLDCHLESPSLTWTHRLKICLQAAKGLRYLHDPRGTHQRLIHRDIKSANVLLDKEWNAKVSDFGLSKMGPANEPRSYVVTNAAGTPGYCDPTYMQTYTLTKESDVYSFGVVLFEVLCGKLCSKYSNGQLQVFVPMWKKQCKENKLAEIIFHDLKHQLDATSLKIFADIAYQCLMESRKQRPTMSQVVEKLKKSLQVQEAYEEKSQELLREVQQEKQDLLIKWIEQDLGFSRGLPVAACLIYNSLLHWRSFEIKRTTVFDRIIEAIISAAEKDLDSNHALDYWLCNTSTLLTLLTHTFKATPQRPTSLFGRMSQKLRTSPQSAGRTDQKIPALLFHEQLTDLLMKIYGISRDNLKKELSPLLDLCITAPRASREAVAPWKRIVKEIDNRLKPMKDNFVTPLLVQKLFTQIFMFINVQLFNSFLLRRECCSFSHGEYVKAGLAELEQWCYDATEEYAGTAWDELAHIRQAVGFLCIHQKPKKTLRELTQDLCPVLNIQQLYRISTMYWDDKYGTHSVSSKVIGGMRDMMAEDSNSAVYSSFLLDDDSSIPFSVNDIYKYTPQVETDNIEFPPLILENSGFEFLHQRTE